MAQSSSEKCSVIGRKPLMNYIGSIWINCETNEEYAAFLGVPYAKAPVGLKRYQAPESLASTESPDNSIPVYEANETKKPSAQLLSFRVVGSADCLYLNIFLPKKPELIQELLPVLVYIHGGGFTFGSNHYQSCPPDTIIKHGLVFVTINYRLGLHGFLNAHKKICPGNAGLKDQVKALEWIRDNIECFKGDPKNVTLSGGSAGATSVNLHLIAPASRGLFHKAIVQSGGIHSPWGYRGRRREQIEKLMADWECRRLLFANVDSDRVHIRANEVLFEDREIRHPRSFTPLYGPTLETIKEGAFISDDVNEMMKNVEHDIPVMAGITKEEGIHIFSLDKRKNYLSWIAEDYFFRELLMDSFRWSTETADQFVDLIRNEYFPGWSSMSERDRARSFARFMRDIHFRQFYENFKFGPEKTVHKNLYVYQFNHYSELSCVSRENLSHFEGEATHGDELKYLYCPTQIRDASEKFINEGEEQNPEIRRVMDHMSSLWANFCKTGIPRSDVEPNVEWRRHTEEKPCYLSISNNLVLVEEPLYKDSWNWLNSIVDNQPVVESVPPTPPTPEEPASPEVAN